MFKFRKSTKKNKKYDAVFNDKVVSFGDNRYEQYKDNALGIYSNLDHLDNKRRLAFKNRFKKSSTVKYSPAWFSDRFLW